MRPVLVVVDVDGVVSPVDVSGDPGPTLWGDDVVVGNVFGPVLASPSLVAHLDALSQVPGVRCLWLTSWSPEMRSRMNPFPGRTWPALMWEDVVPAGMAGRRRWWKLVALERWLAAGAAGSDDAAAERVESVVWLDDDLRHGARKAACRRRLDAVGAESLLIAPRRSVGVTPQEMLQVGEWVKSRVEESDRHLLDVAWRVSSVAPCGCAWAGRECPHCSTLGPAEGGVWSSAHTINCHNDARAGAESHRRRIRRRP